MNSPSSMQLYVFGAIAKPSCQPQGPWPILRIGTQHADDSIRVVRRL